MDAELIDRLCEFVCGYRLREDDAAVIRAAIAALAATPQAAAAARGYVDDDRKRVVSSLQEMHDRLGGFLVGQYGDRFDGDIDTMLDAMNLLKAVKIATPQAAQVPEDAVTRLAIYLAEKDGHDPHALIWEGSPPEPWGEVWNRYEPEARAMLAAAPAAPQVAGVDSPEDRFEQFLQAEIARSPDALQELGSYLADVLDEDKFPRANRLLLQLATSFSAPAAPASEGVVWPEPAYRERVYAGHGNEEVCDYYTADQVRAILAAQAKAEPVAWTSREAIEDTRRIEIGAVRFPNCSYERAHFPIPLYLDPPRADFIETVKRARQVWLDENPGEDGTDQVTPFDRFLYGA
jgi:hypothetical protein